MKIEVSAPELECIVSAIKNQEGSKALFERLGAELDKMPRVGSSIRLGSQMVKIIKFDNGRTLVEYTDETRYWVNDETLENGL